MGGEQQSELRAGIVGTGNLGTETAYRLQDIDGVALHAAADAYAGAAFEDEFGITVADDYSSILDDIDLLFIANAHSGHYDVAKDALECGIPTHVEKPLTIDGDRAIDLVETAEEHDVPLATGFQRHFEPAFQNAREIINSGEIGDVHGLSCDLNQHWLDKQKGTWRTDGDISGGGNLMDSGSHGLDAALFITDSTPVAVTDAKMSYVDEAQVDGVQHGADRGIEEAAYVEALFDGDTRTFSATFTVRGYVPDSGGRLRRYLDKFLEKLSGPDREDVTHDWRSQIVVNGSDADLVYQHAVDIDGDDILSDTSVSVQYDDRTEHVPFDEDTDTLYEKVADFVDAVKNDREPAVTGRDGAYVTLIADAAYRLDPYEGEDDGQTYAADINTELPDDQDAYPATSNIVEIQTL